VCQKCGRDLDYEINEDDQVEVSPCTHCLDEFLTAKQQVTLEEAFQDVFRVMRQAGEAAVENQVKQIENGVSHDG